MRTDASNEPASNERVHTATQLRMFEPWMTPGARFHFRAWQHTVGEGSIRTLAHIDSMSHLKAQLGDALAGLGLEYAVHERGCSAEEALAATVGCSASDLDSGRYVLFTIEWDYLESYATSGGEGLHCARGGPDRLEEPGLDPATVRQDQS